MIELTDEEKRILIQKYIDTGLSVDVAKQKLNELYEDDERKELLLLNSINTTLNNKR
jgi:hypothetical protein